MATITSHTLSSQDGTHAADILFTLVNLSSGIELFSVATDSKGRLSESVDLSGMHPDDRYEVRLQTANYWERQGVVCPNFIDEIVLRLRMPDHDARYHMPVILSPYSYSTWASQPEKE